MLLAIPAIAASRLRNVLAITLAQIVGLISGYIHAKRPGELPLWGDVLLVLIFIGPAYWLIDPGKANEKHRG